RCARAGIPRQTGACAALQAVFPSSLPVSSDRRFRPDRASVLPRDRASQPAGMTWIKVGSGALHTPARHSNTAPAAAFDACQRKCRAGQHNGAQRRPRSRGQRRLFRETPMNSTTDVIAGVGLADANAKSRWPARLDWMQSASGLLLALFMWGHMFFVSTILISNDAMWTITKFFEGYFFFGRSYPVIVSIVVAGVIAMLVAHAFLAVRKFPINYRQFTVFRGHMKMMRHEDTTL